MGRPLFSTTLIQKQTNAPVVRVAVAGDDEPSTHGPTYDRWSQWNAFDPDSEEFFADSNIIDERPLSQEELDARRLEALGQGQQQLDGVANTANSAPANNSDRGNAQGGRRRTFTENNPDADALVDQFYQYANAVDARNPVLQRERLRQRRNQEQPDRILLPTEPGVHIFPISAIPDLRNASDSDSSSGSGSGRTTPESDQPIFVSPPIAGSDVDHAMSDDGDVDGGAGGGREAGTGQEAERRPRLDGSGVLSPEEMRTFWQYVNEQRRANGNPRGGVPSAWRPGSGVGSPANSDGAVDIDVDADDVPMSAAREESPLLLPDPQPVTRTNANSAVDEMMDFLARPPAPSPLPYDAPVPGAPRLPRRPAEAGFITIPSTPSPPSTPPPSGYRTLHNSPASPDPDTSVLTPSFDRLDNQLSPPPTTTPRFLTWSPQGGSRPTQSLYASPTPSGRYLSSIHVAWPNSPQNILPIHTRQ